MDRWTRILLWVIAVGIWMNAINPWVAPTQVRADSDLYLSTYLQSIDRTLKRLM